MRDYRPPSQFGADWAHSMTLENNVRHARKLITAWELDLGHSLSYDDCRTLLSEFTMWDGDMVGYVLDTLNTKD